MPMIHRKPSLILLFWPTVFPSPSSLSWATSCCSTDPESISSLITCLHVSQSREQTQSIAFLLKPRNEAWVKGKHPCSFALAGGWMGRFSGVKCQFLYSHLGGWALVLMLECGDTFGLLFSGLLSTYFFSSVRLLSCIWLLATPWPAAYQASLSIISSQSLLKLMSIKSVMPSNHLILCHPLLFLPSIFPSIRVFSNESILRIRWPKYWSFSFNISPSNEHSGLISFRVDWFDLLAVQGTLKSLLQHCSSKTSNSVYL